MDANWCQFCEQQLPLLSEEEDYETQSDDDSRKHSKTLSTSSGGSSTHANPRHKTKAKLKRATSGNAIAGKMSKLAMSTASESIKEFRTSQNANKGKKVTSSADWSWAGLYCSAECMAQDEQRSRLAIANLESSRPPTRIPVAPPSSSSSRSRSGSEDNISRTHSQPALHNWAHRPSSLSQHRLHSYSQPSALVLDNRRQSLNSDQRGSSDSLSSAGQHSPRAYSPSLPSTRRSNLGAMTPIRPAFDTLPEEDGFFGRDAVDSVQSDKDSLKLPQTANSDVIASTLRPSPPSRTPSAASVARLRSSQSLARSVVATPVLSQGTEGHAMGTISTNSGTSVPERGTFFPHGRAASLHRGHSSASVPRLSCSPSSPASSTLSTFSNQSNASTAPSEYILHKGDRRSASSIHLPIPDKGVAHTTLHDYGLYSSVRPSRTPSFPALHTIQPYGKSPPVSDGGPISQIIHAKVQQRYNTSSRNGTRRNSAGLGNVPFPSFETDSQESTPTLNPTFRKSGSNASVTSLPHYLAEHTDQRRSMDSERPERPEKSDRSGTSAPKAWNWETLPAYVPKYKAMATRKGSGDDTTKKRLFYFSSETFAPDE